MTFELQKLQSLAQLEWFTSTSTALVMVVVAALSIFYVYLFSRIYHDLPTTPTSGPVRPIEILEAIDKNNDIYIFGVGSNLSRTKVEQRSVNGKKIRPKSMEPCRIEDCRLAFNMRASPPLEPAFGSLEPLPSFHDKKNRKNIHPSILRRSDSRALVAYEESECHGALIRLSAEDYQLVFSSEGADLGALCPYEEIMVVCVPYDKSKPPVKAVAYRTREHTRSKQDLCPSKRYMGIIREGAAELGLDDTYQKWLKNHPVSDPSTINKKFGKYSTVFSHALLHRFNIRSYGIYQGMLLERVYVLPTESKWKQVISEIAAAVIMFPPAFGGLIMHCIDSFDLVPGGVIPPVMKKWMEVLD